MAAHRTYSPLLIMLAVGIGCGGGKPQSASATTDETPIQLAQAPASSESSPPAPASTNGGPGGQAPASAQPAASGTASITGVVRLEGSAPTRQKVKMDGTPECLQQRTEPAYSEEVVVNANGTLQHVLVYVKSGAQGTFPAPTAAAVLDQAGCWYTPHVFGLQTNQPLEIVNSDATLHNVNAKPVANQPFNIAQPKQGMKTVKRFTKAEVPVKFKCNVHPWMTAYAGVFEHPFFAVSGSDGAFTIQGLPAGTYVLEAWQEKYGTQTQTVSVAEGEAKSVAFTFTGQ